MSEELRHDGKTMTVSTSDLVNYEKAWSVVKAQALPTLQTLSIESQKVLALVLAQVNSKSEFLTGMTYRIKMEDYQALSGIESDKTAWMHMQSACNELSSTRLDIKPKDILDEIVRPSDHVNPFLKRGTLTLRNIAIVDTADYYSYDRFVDIRISKGFEPYIINVSRLDKYNKDRVITTLKISSKTTMRFYRKLNEFRYSKRQNHWWQQTLEEFKLDMGLAVDKHMDIRNLRRRVIEPAIKTLNQASEYGSIKYKTITKGRKVIGLRFDYVVKLQQQLDL